MNEGRGEVRGRDVRHIGLCALLMWYTALGLYIHIHVHVCTYTVCIHVHVQYYNCIVHMYTYVHAYIQYSMYIHLHTVCNIVHVLHVLTSTGVGFRLELLTVFLNWSISPTPCLTPPSERP